MDSPLQRPVTDLCSMYREQVCRKIFDIIGDGKKLRARLNGLGITSPGGGSGPAMPAVAFPLAGDLAHITNAKQLTDMIRGLEILEEAMGTPNDGIVAGAAFASFLG